MDIENLMILNNEFMRKNPGVVPEQGPFIILDSKSEVCMENNGKDTKHTRHIYRIMHFVINGEY